MTRLDGNTISVSEDADVYLAGRRANALLDDLDFDGTIVHDVVLVVHELASNIVKHAGEGAIDLEPELDGRPRSIEVRATDSGPGIADVDQAVVDGYSTVGSLGSGLGTVFRLMDDVVITSNGDSGVEILATRREAPLEVDDVAPTIDVDGATRPQPGYEQNGDAFLIEHGRDQTLVCVIDGLGHGPHAHQAAMRAHDFVRTNPTQPLADLFEGVERVCRDTRGVVMLLARFRWSSDSVTLGSVGNITLRVCQTREPFHLVSERGVLGGNASNPRIDQWELPPNFVMVIHTDGIASDWRCSEFSWGSDTAKATSAPELLRGLSKQDDDATVIVIRGADH